ncbi:hypothetical protein EV182_007371, partial [Spiromyces aspiralis]
MVIAQAAGGGPSAAAPPTHTLVVDAPEVASKATDDDPLPWPLHPVPRDDGETSGSSTNPPSDGWMDGHIRGHKTHIHNHKRGLEALLD